MPLSDIPPLLLASLPVRVTKAVSLASPFADSTHALWRLETLDARTLFLKVVQNTSSPFWQIMQKLFGLNLGQQLGDYQLVYRQVSELTPLSAPTLLACAAQSSQSPAYLFTTALLGENLNAEQVDDEMVIALARHLFALHAQQSETWGNFFDANNSAESWSLALRAVLGTYFADDCKLQAFHHVPVCFVPMMLDLRWDQFLLRDGKLNALVDLDAFVIAPIELEFVLLEYILTPEQLLIWCSAYQLQGGKIPKITVVRDSYRRLLFAMQVLGESDLTRWLGQAHFFA
jgi:hypothetical protein